MNDILKEMLENNDSDIRYNQKNAIKEIIQEIVLCGLSRAGFFKKAAFYGGTALRIFYGLDRFSEDLDFSLESPDEYFDLSSYFDILDKEIRSFGLNFDIKEKEKTADSNIKSAFLKGNTKEHLLLFYANESIAGTVAGNDIIKIKFEVDINPPAQASYETKYRLIPVPYELKMYDMPSLFAGKIHAVLARGWRNRIKGRDLYDYVFYLSRNSRVNLPHLVNRLVDSGYVEAGNIRTIKDIHEMLYERFDKIDYSHAKRDVEPFIHDHSKLNIWNADFFKQITDNLKEV